MLSKLSLKRLGDFKQETLQDKRNSEKKEMARMRQRQRERKDNLEKRGRMFEGI